MRGWVFDPHSGGVKIPERVRRRTAERIQKYAAEHHAGKYTRLDVRFHGVFCYVDAYADPEEPSKELLKLRGETREQFLEFMRNLPHPLLRLRHFTEDRWSISLYTYSNEQYSATIFPNGEFFGTPEEAFEVAAEFL